jgi:hypothetical protein
MAFAAKARVIASVITVSGPIHDPNPHQILTPSESDTPASPWDEQVW